MSAQRLSDLVRLVRANNPSPITLEGTNTYIVGDRHPVVIDPGPNDQAHLDAVLDEAGEPSVIVLTHHHPDHAEGADRFAAMARAPVAAHASNPDLVCAGESAIADGQTITASGLTLRALFTPGHASDHLCFFLEEERALFTGDHVLGRGTTVIAHPDGDMAAYFASLDKAAAARAERLYPGHGPVIDDPERVLTYYKEHRIEREHQILDAITAGEDTVAAMVERIYAAYDVALHGAAALSVLAHLKKLSNDGLVRTDGERWHRSN